MAKMDIYVVQPGDTLDSIAEAFGVSAERLYWDNDLENPDSLVTGQTIVIAYPEQTHTVSEGDTLEGIAAFYGITVMQLLRNNPTLANDMAIYSGETLIISYPTIGRIATHGYTYTYINPVVLKKTLPSLTYLTIFNYRSTGEGEVIAFYDDTDIIRIAKQYGVVPLMMVTTLTAQGIPNMDIANNILSNIEYQERHIGNILNILHAQGYYGVNIVLNFLNKQNQELYFEFLQRIYERLHSEGYLCFVTVNTDISSTDDNIIFDRIDYSQISSWIDGIIFIHFIWGSNAGPPAPVSSAANLNAYLDYVTMVLSPDKVIAGSSIISYVWPLPYIPGTTTAYSLTINSALSLARDLKVEIQFDERSQTPFFQYSQFIFGAPIQHIAWSVDARTIRAMIDQLRKYTLSGCGIWTVMVYFAQLWLLINSQYDVIKVIPDSLQSGNPI